MSFNKITKILTAGAVSGLMSTAAFAEDVTLRLAGVVPIDHQGTKTMQQVADDVAAANVGLKIDLFSANQLGSGEALFENVARGNIDLAAAFIYADTDPRLKFLSMPFLVSGWDEMSSIVRNMDSEYNKILLEITDEYRVSVLAQNPEGFVSVVATKEPTNWNTFDDIRITLLIFTNQFMLRKVDNIRLKDRPSPFCLPLPSGGVWRDWL